MAWMITRKDRQGGRRIHVQWRENGRVRSKSTGGNDLRRAAELLEWAQAREGRPLSASDLKTPQEALDAYVRHQELRSIAEGTIRWCRGKLGRLVREWADLPMAKWSRPHLELYIHQRREEDGWAPGTVNGFLTACSGWISWARDAGAPFGDFVGGLKRAIVEETEQAVLTEAQVFALIDAAEAHGIRLALALAGCTGMRRSEILRLQWEDVDLDAGVIRIRGKTKKGRAVAMHAKLKAVLLEEPGVTGNVLRTHRHSTAFYYGLRRAYEKAEVPYQKGRPLHGLRHALVSNLLEGGVPIPAVQEIVGHRRLETTGRYAKPREETKRRALEGYGG